MSGLVFAVLLFGQNVPTEAVTHINQGVEAQKRGDRETAITEFKQVTELAPDLPAAFVNLGAAYIEDGQFQQAVPQLQHAIELDPKLVGAEQMLGYAMLMQGYAAESLAHFEKAGAADGMGIAELKLGRLSQAVTHLETALEKQPNNPELLYYLGRASGLLSKQVFDTLISNYPDSARSHQALAENYAGLRRVPEAEKEYSEAFHLQPSIRGAHLALGELYATASQWPKAEEQFRLEAELQPGDAETAYRFGSALLQDGKLKEARTELERADKLRPDMPETLYSLGKAASLSGDSAAAQKAWRQQLSIEKDSALAGQAHFGLAGIYRKQGKTTEAAQELQEYKRLQPPATPAVK